MAADNSAITIQRVAQQHRAQQARIPVAIVNRGATRGDPLADIKVDAALGEVLPTLAGAPA